MLALRHAISHSPLTQHPLSQATKKKTAIHFFFYKPTRHMQMPSNARDHHRHSRSRSRSRSPVRSSRHARSSRSPPHRRHHHRDREEEPHSHHRKEVNTTASSSSHRHKHKRRRTASPPAQKKQQLPPAIVSLPFKARPLAKRDYAAYEAIFGLYLDVQKQIVLDELDEKEAKGRWKSFVGKWYVFIRLMFLSLLVFELGFFSLACILISSFLLCCLKIIYFHVSSRHNVFNPLFFLFVFGMCLSNTQHANFCEESRRACRRLV